jgi:hypothetical protein
MPESFLEFLFVAGRHPLDNGVLIVGFVLAIFFGLLATYRSGH